MRKVINIIFVILAVIAVLYGLVEKYGNYSEKKHPIKKEIVSDKSSRIDKVNLKKLETIPN